MLLALALPEALLIAAVIIAVAIVAAAWILVKRLKIAFSSEVEFPRSDEGNPIEPSGVVVDAETRLEKGTTVLAFSQGRWWRAEVIGLEPGGRVRIHFPGWDSKWDTVVPRHELQVDLQGPG